MHVTQFETFRSRIAAIEHTEYLRDRLKQTASAVVADRDLLDLARDVCRLATTKDA